MIKLTWQVENAGPMQVNKVRKSLSKFESRAMQTEEVHDEYTVVVSKISLAGDQQYADGFRESLQAIGEKYGWTITRKNAAQLAKDIDSAKASLVIPVVDCRTMKAPQ